MKGIAPQGATVVVTGAGSGIGHAIAVRYAQLGATVIATDIDEAAAKATAEACRQTGGQAFSLFCDVADAESVRDLSRYVPADIAPVDILVNNAGVGVGGPFLATDENDWEWLRSVNLDGVVHGCRYFGADMVTRQRGQIVNIASGAAYLPNRRLATYCASKAAVLMLSRCLRADWARHHVGVSAICPGVINTPILANTRLRGSAVDEQPRMARIFSMSHSPNTVAKAVTRAAERNQPMASVGLEVRVAYQVQRLLPIANGALARL